MEDTKRQRKNDLLLLAGILAIGLIIGGIWKAGKTNTAGGTVVVTVEGKEYGSYPLNKNATIEIKGHIGTNTLEIKDGQVTMTEAVCPDQICVRHKPIRANGEMIICLPGLIIVEIVGGEENELDSVTG